MDLDRKQLKVVQGKGKKDRYLPLSEHLIRGLKKYIEAEKPEDFLFGEPRGNRAGGEFDSRYSQRGVQWAVKQASKTAKILKEVCVHTLRHSFATHLLEDGMNIVSIKNLLGHENIETTSFTFKSPNFLPKNSSRRWILCLRNAERSSWF